MYRGLAPHKITPMSGVLHTEPRSPCVLKWRITCRRPVIVDVELKTNCFSCFLSGCELHFGVLFLLRLGSTSGYNDF